ncbi:MAG: endolytic transglycosylase MltG [Candidatus Nanopelagicales bacterium]
MSQLLPFLSQDPLPPSKNRRSPVRWTVLALGILALVAASIWATVTIRGLAPAEEASVTAGQQVLVVVNTGDSLGTLANSLASAGVVSSASAFLASAELDERATRIGPGVYTLTTGMDPASVIDAMLDPATRAAPLVLPEGLRIDETVRITAEATGIPQSDLETVLDTPAAMDLPSWAKGRPEGLLFPASYDIIPGRTADEVVQAMISRFGLAADEVKLERNAKKLGYSPYEVLTVASLVQAEVAPADFRKVARVVYNRLAQGMKLQFDSTVNYALKTDTFFLTDDMLSVNSPYNTFAVEGLPPTPINSPGQEALEAALSPAKGDWLYFVTTDPDTLTTRFTADYDQFLKWKQQFREGYAATAAPSPGASS